MPNIKLGDWTVTFAIFALTTTFPVGLLTVMPAPVDLLTELTEALVRPLYTSSKLFCTFGMRILSHLLMDHQETPRSQYFVGSYLFYLI